MLIQQTPDEFLALARQAPRVIAFREMIADYLTPISVFAALREEMQGGTLLESGAKDIGTGRYSFLGFEQMGQIKITGNEVSTTLGNATKLSKTEPLTALRDFMQTLNCKSTHAIPGITGGTVGFVTYDAIRLFEKIPDRHQAASTLPDMVFNGYRKTITFDHQELKIIVAVVVDISSDPQQDYVQAQQDITQVVDKINHFNFTDISVSGNTARPDVKVIDEVNDPQFIECIQQAKNYITQGDAFQIVLSRAFTMPVTVSPFDIYRGLRHVSPAPYMFYLDLGDSVIVGASPEKLVGLHEGQVTINPIAGTRLRKTLQEDAALAADLLNDKKEVAEHMMLVDLARNDIGIICKPGSIKVQELKQIKYYSHVIHMTSLVSGELKEGYDAFDVLKAAFPEGTVSGAPKIRAMEIIDELETTRRGLYGGGICCIDSQGNLDSCIAIRMAVLKNKEARLQAGAGVVFDSIPEAEAAETRHKVKSIVEGIIFAEQHFS